MQYYFETSEFEGVGLEEALEYKLTFGKHIGQSLGELCKDPFGRSYLRYIQKNTSNPLVSVHINVVLTQTPEVSPTLEDAGYKQMNFGKYKTLQLMEIIRMPGGYEYLMHVSRFDGCDQVLKACIEVIHLERERQIQVHKSHK
jgi:hypothetical protein